MRLSPQAIIATNEIIHRDMGTRNMLDGAKREVRNDKRQDTKPAVTTPSQIEKLLDSESHVSSIATMQMTSQAAR